MKKMRAAVLEAPGKLVVKEVDVPEIKSDTDVLIRVKKVGICGSDLGRVMVTGTYHFPTIIGHEFCGEVAECGDGVERFKKGDRVIVAPILPCGKCDSCQEGHFGQCENYNYLGSRTDGGMAEYVLAPEKNLLPIPDDVSFEEGAVVEPAAVTLHGIKKMDMTVSDTVVVLGCGTIGLLAIQFARINKVKSIIAVDIDETKLSWAKEFGADICVNSMETDCVEKILSLTGNKGADIAIETAGSAVTQEQCFRACRSNGKILLLGTAHKDVVLPIKTYERIVRGELTIKGSWNSYSSPFPGSEWTDTINCVSEGSLNLKGVVSHVIRLEDLPCTIEDMFNKKIIFNKVIVDIDL